MSIYEKPTRALMREMANKMPMLPGQILTKQAIVDWFSKNYPKLKQGTVGAHLIMLSTNAPSRVHHSPKPGEDDLFFQTDGSHFRLYEPATDPPPIQGAAGEKVSQVPTIPSGEPEDEEEPSSFAYESDLKNFLARNPQVLERGLRVYEEDGINGVEFPVGGRFVDILAVDSQGEYVVIELKVSRGHERVVGQLLRYMGWIAKNHADIGQRVRGIIVARTITEDLILACSRLKDVQLFEYEMSVSVKRIVT